MIYLCSPYSSPTKGLMQYRYEYVAKRVAEFMKDGITVFSPILHCHPIAEKYNMPREFEFWKQHDLTFIDACTEVWVLKMAGYDLSVGIKGEVEYAESLGKKVTYIECGDLGFKCEECEIKGVLDYTVSQGMSTTTLLGWIPVFDRDGKLLNKNPNKTSTQMFCSNGHQWVHKV